MPSLLSLSIKNYRSFYTEQVLEFGESTSRPVTALFGPNSGGKSNTAKALMLIQSFIVNSSRADWALPYDPFLLRVGSTTEPTQFSLRFVHSKREYEYTFAYDSTHIVFEELKEQSANTKKMAKVFTRLDGKLSTVSAKNKFGNALFKKTRDETLLITKAREDNNPYSNIIFDLIEGITVIPGDLPDMTGQIVDLLNKNPELKKKTIDFMRNCDFAIRGIEFVDAPPIPEEILNSMPFNDEIKKMFANSPSVAIKTVHAIRDAERTVVDTCYFDLLGQESMGTRKFFEMTVPILDAIENGKTLYYDEFGSYIHPALAKAIIELLKSSDNDKSASLILNTHSTSIMSNAGLDRDEIIFIEKGLSEESIISPLNERAVRANESFEKRYREGLYGAVPVIRERA